MSEYSYIFLISIISLDSISDWILPNKLVYQYPNVIIKSGTYQLNVKILNDTKKQISSTTPNICNLVLLADTTTVLANAVNISLSTVVIDDSSKYGTYSTSVTLQTNDPSIGKNMCVKIHNLSNTLGLNIDQVELLYIS
jgi:hypothetical protein